MPWVKLDDRFWSEPKVERAGNEAAGVFARMLSYCGQHLTDGHISDDAARYICRSRKPFSALLEVGLIERNGHGYIIPAYLDFNPSREKQVEEREKARERMRELRGNKT